MEFMYGSPYRYLKANETTRKSADRKKLMTSAFRLAESKWWSNKANFCNTRAVQRMNLHALTDVRVVPHGKCFPLPTIAVSSLKPFVSSAFSTKELHRMHLSLTAIRNAHLPFDFQSLRVSTLTSFVPNSFQIFLFFYIFVT